MKKRNSESILTEYFKPSVYLKSFADIDVEYFRNSRIKYFLCDLDGTLISLEYQKIPKKPVLEFIQKIKSLGIKFIVISNNRKKRVSKISEIMKCDDYYSSCFKPSVKCIKKVMKKYKCTNKEIIVMGNTLFTDILMANRMNVDSILVSGVEAKNRWFYRIVEKYIYKKLNRKNLLVAGKINDIFKGEKNELL